MSESSSAVQIVRVAAITFMGACAFSWMGPVDAWQQAAPGSCRVSGRTMSGSIPLPGVSIVAAAGDAIKAATSSDPDGTYHLALPIGPYTLAADLTGFTRVTQTVNGSKGIHCMIAKAVVHG